MLMSWLSPTIAAIAPGHLSHPPTTMDPNFLTERFKAFGFEFQIWMVLVAVGLVLYAVYMSLKERNGGPH
jgi:disulfide bond formation protein DsbB